MHNKPGITLEKIGDAGASLKARLEMLSKVDVLVGIPQKNNHSDDHPGIGNATLLFIHSNGSPARGIPKRAVIEPAIAADGNRQAIQLDLKAAGKAMLGGNANEAYRQLKLAGTTASNAAKAWFFDPRNNWPPLKPATIRRKGSAQPLIDFGSMRKAITYVVRTVK